MGPIRQRPLESGKKPANSWLQGVIGRGGMGTRSRGNYMEVGREPPRIDETLPPGMRRVRMAMLEVRRGWSASPRRGRLAALGLCAAVLVAGCYQGLDARPGVTAGEDDA